MRKIFRIDPSSRMDITLELLVFRKDATGIDVVAKAVVHKSYREESDVMETLLFVCYGLLGIKEREYRIAQTKFLFEGLEEEHTWYVHVRLLLPDPKNTPDAL